MCAEVAKFSCSARYSLLCCRLSRKLTTLPLNHVVSDGMALACAISFNAQISPQVLGLAQIKINLSWVWTLERLLLRRATINQVNCGTEIIFDEFLQAIGKCAGELRRLCILPFFYSSELTLSRRHCLTVLLRQKKLPQPLQSSTTLHKDPHMCQSVSQIAHSIVYEQQNG